MEFNFYENLSKEDALSFLEKFISIGNKESAAFRLKLKQESVEIDYTVNSIVQLFNWLLSKVKLITRQRNKNLPEWILESTSYKKGLYEFDENSKILIVKVAFYLGECFIKMDRRLHWAVGKKNTAKKNMPVIAGFKMQMELAPLLVTENLIKRIVEGENYIVVEEAIYKWCSYL